MDKNLHCGRALAKNEKILFESRPSLRHLAIGVFHVRPVISYFVLMAALVLARAIGGHVPWWAALMPLASGAFVAGLLILAAWGIRRTTLYVITDRRIVLRYGLVFPRALSIPFAQVASMAVTMDEGAHGSIALKLHSPNRMPYLKLWPHARPWILREPQPMLRGLQHAGVAATTLARFLVDAEQQRTGARQAERPVAA